MSLSLPTYLTNGTSLLMDSNFTDRLHFGDATVGWIGDPRLGIYHNPREDRVEVHRLCEDGEMRLIVRSRPGQRILDIGLLKFLADHDSQSRRQYDVVADIDKKNNALKADQRRQTEGKLEESFKRIAWGAEKDGLFR
jgi:hypothetical protein